jgi:hypothetical protein
MNPVHPVSDSPRRRSWLALVGALVLYAPLEEFALRWLPVGPTGIALLRLVPEGLLFAALALVWAGHRARGLTLPRTAIGVPLFTFLGLALLSTALSDGEPLSGLANLRVLVRYAALYYLVVALAPDEAERRHLVNLLWGGALLQAALGLGQYATGGAGAFWLPRDATLELAGLRRDFTAVTGGIERGAALGTTAHPVAFALFLLVGGLVAAARALLAPPGRRTGPTLAVVLCGLGIVASFSRATVFAYGLGLVFLLVLLRRERTTRALLGVLLALLPAAGALWLLRSPGPGVGGASEKDVAVGALTSLESLGSGTVLERARRSRLWVLEDVGAAVVASTGWLGHGPDEQHAKARIGAAGGATLHRLIAYKAFEDVYWVALLAYYGFAGLAALLWLLVRLGESAWALAREPHERGLAVAALAVLVAALPLAFVVRTFEFRAFALSFWLLFGLVAAARGARPARVV